MLCEKNKNSLNLKFKPYNISSTVQTGRDSIQGSEIHSELLFRYCNCYSDTRGVTMARLVRDGGAWRLISLSSAVATAVVANSMMF
jgi:hypothetical protein